MQINIRSGDNPRVEAGAPALDPLKVCVSDACDSVVDTPFAFSVARGVGKVNFQEQVTVPTGLTGHAEVDSTLGPNGGNNVVRGSGGWCRQRDNDCRGNGRTRADLH